MALKPKIVTIGAGTFDVFLVGEAMAAHRDVRTHATVEQFPLGAKISVDNVVFSTGGGATNAAVTFARAGFSTSFVGKIGDDLPGREVLAALKREGVKTNLVVCDLKGDTGYSTILLAPSGERSILVYRGVSEELQPSELKFSSQTPDWIYMSSLAGNLDLLAAILNQARNIGAKVAYNPGGLEIKKASELKKLLKQVTIVSLNKEEAMHLFGKDSTKEILMAAAEICPTVVITDGPKGASVTDGQTIYESGLYEDVKVIDRTGAGDAFASGFVAAVALERSLPEALTFASANSTSVVRSIGSKAGILHIRDKIRGMNITESSL